jgi:type II secretory pathway component HofQ
MSINPVSAIVTPNDLARDSTPRVGPRRVAAAAKQPDMGPRSNREVPQPQSAPATFELPQDEVQVQRDPAGSGQIVIKYLDGKGNLILQVPSSQVLGLARAIEQTFAAQAKDRAETPPPAEEGATHAD